jgi:DNA polymerase-3 subunit alpha
LCQRLQELQMPAVAITDIANLFALIKFYKASLKAGLKPVCGCDVRVRDEERGGETHLVLLVKNHAGYLNLTELISALYTDNPSHGAPVLSKAKLAGHTEGLIALSGAQSGDIGTALLANETALASELLADWQRLFPDSFYLELQRVGKPDEEDYIDAAVTLALKSGCPVVATNDVRFLHQDDFDAHEVPQNVNEIGNRQVTARQ